MSSNNQHDGWTEASFVIYDIQTMMQNRLRWKILFNYRETNLVAHLLAQLAISLTWKHIWMKECPRQIMSVDEREKLCNA